MHTVKFTRLSIASEIWAQGKMYASTYKHLCEVLQKPEKYDQGRAVLLLLPHTFTDFGFCKLTIMFQLYLTRSRFEQ